MGNFNKGDIIRRNSGNESILPLGTICEIKRFIGGKISIVGSYNTYVSDNFELVFPKKWCIRGSDELRHWQKYDMNDQCNSSFYQNDFFYYLIDDELIDEWDYIERPPDGYTEITFQQFQIYILKKNIRKPFKLTRK
jgi:hypothetical protein